MFGECRQSHRIGFFRVNVTTLTVLMNPGE